MRAPFVGSVVLLFGSMLVASCGEVSTPSGTGGAGGGAGSGGSGISGACTEDAACIAGGTNFCAATDDGACGPVVGMCVMYPASCGEGTYHTVCGCDGKTHAAGPCPAGLSSSLQVDPRPGACPANPGEFWCGEAACAAGAQYCVEGFDAVSCDDLPASCTGADATCACLEPLGVTECGCVDEPGGGIRVNGCGI